MKTNNDIDKLYKHRFEDTGLTFRTDMWRILCTDFFQKYIHNNDVVLDIPCGYCEFINSIDVKHKIAIDINPDSAKYAAKNVHFIQSSSEKIPLESSSIDKIFISNFFEHLTREQIGNTVLELKRILKKGGQILILQPNIRFCSKDYWMFFDHVTPIDDRALDELFELHGFTCITKILKFLPYTTKSKFPKNLSLIRLYLKAPLLWRIFGAQTFVIYEN